MDSLINNIQFLKELSSKFYVYNLDFKIYIDLIKLILIFYKNLNKKLKLMEMEKIKMDTLMIMIQFNMLIIYLSLIITVIKIIKFQKYLEKLKKIMIKKILGNIIQIIIILKYQDID